MAKSSKSPSKAGSRVIKKSSAFDDQADESDGGGEGVLIDRAARDDGDTDVDRSNDAGEADGTNLSDYDFINDGDPYEGYASDGVLSAADSLPPSKSPRKKPPLFMSASPSPPTTPIKVRGGRALAPDAPFTPSPSKRKASSPDVIELGSSSEEDLEAMALDDSEFKKPSNVKSAALPLSLLTRSAAKQRSSAPLSDNAGDHPSPPSRKKLKISATPVISRSASPEDVSEPVAGDLHLGGSFVDASSSIDGAMSSDDGDAEAAFLRFAKDPKTSQLVNSFLSAYMREHSGKTNVDPIAPTASQGSITRAANPVASGSKSSTRGKSHRVDHDNVALQKGIISSLHGSSSKSALKEPRPLSPDWEPPTVTDLLSQASNRGRSSKRKNAEDVVRSTSVRKPVPEVVSPTSIKAKGKEKAPGQSSRSETKPRLATKSKDGDLSKFVEKKKFPVSSASGGAAEGEPPLTMAQYMCMARGEEPSADDAKADDVVDDDDDEPPAYLEDLEAYRTYYDPKSKCSVFDVNLQDPSLRPHYVGLPPLPALRIILPSYDPNRNSTDDVDFSTGGRVQFSCWASVLPRILAANSMGAMLFTDSGHFINPSRVSPVKLSSVISPGSSQTHRMHVDNRVAVCVSPVCVTESCVFAPKNIGSKSDRQRKWLYGVFHDYDWERFCSLTCLVFSERVMYAQINNQAISFQTMISRDGGRQADVPMEKLGNNIPSQLFSSQSPGKTVKNKPAGTFRTKTLLAHNDTIPVYDARKIVVDYTKDLGRLDQVLPLFPGEVPPGSFAVVGYSLSCYNGTVSGSSGKVANLGCNIIWVIVCGTPPPPSRT